MNPVLEITVPELLTPREDSFNYLIGVALFSGISFLALARAAQSNVYPALASGLFKTTGVRAFLRDSLPMEGRSSLFLLLNYLVSFGLLVHLLAEYFGIIQIQNWLLATTVPAGILLFHLGCMSISGWITGERDVFRAPVMMKLLGAQLLGILYFICALVWVLQPDYVEITLQVALWAFIVESALRIVKSISVVKSLGVSWYYIILYFCTLEILPLFVCYYYVSQNLRG